MIQALIIEDEKPSARRLQRMLEKENLQVLGPLHSVEDALKWFQENPHPELIFLDIQLSDGLSFEIFDKLEIKSAIIFTTAYDEYALKAFKLNSVDYLMKPIDDEELQAAIEKYKRNRGPQALDLSHLKALLNLSPVEYKRRFTVQVGQHLKLISSEVISCFYSENKGTYLHSICNSRHLQESTLVVPESELVPTTFFIVYRTLSIQLH